MTGIEKFGNWFITLLTAGGTIWAAYTAYDASKIKQPLDFHTAIAQSYKSQIKSATDRGDKEAANLIRVEYEQYESVWRQKQEFNIKLETARAVGLDSISENTRESIIKIHDQLAFNIKAAQEFSQQQEADILYLKGDFQNAALNYSAVIRNNPNDKESAVYGASSLVRAVKSDPKIALPQQEVNQISEILRSILEAGDIVIDANPDKVKSLEDALNEIRTNNE